MGGHSANVFVLVPRRVPAVPGVMMSRRGWRCRWARWLGQGYGQGLVRLESAEPPEKTIMHVRNRARWAAASSICVAADGVRSAT